MAESQWTGPAIPAHGAAETGDHAGPGMGASRPTTFQLWPDARPPIPSCIIVNLTERLKDTHLGRRWLFFFLSVSSRSLQLA